MDIADTYLTPRQIMPMIEHYIKQRRPFILEGDSGIGKSAVIEQVAKKMGILCWNWMRVSQMDNLDIKGGPNLAASVDRVKYFRPEWMPMPSDTDHLKINTSLTNGIVGVLVFDEIGQAPDESVQAALMQVVREFRAGGYEIPNNWALCAATNLEDGRAGVNRMLAPLERRFTWHRMIPDLMDWWNWAFSEDSGIDPWVPGFLKFRPSRFHKFEPNQKVDCNSRAWEGVSQLLSAPFDEKQMLSAVAGTVGFSAAVEFIAWMKIRPSLPNPDAIILRPDKEPVPTALDVQAAIATGLATLASVNNFDAIVTYLDRMGEETSTYGVLAAISRDTKLKNTHAFNKWANRHQDFLY